jgi:hypothetical protein
MEGISIGQKWRQAFKRGADTIRAVAQAAIGAAAKLTVSVKDDPEHIKKANRRARRAYGSRFRSWYRAHHQNGSKLQRKAAQHKLSGRTSRLIQRYERLEMKRRLAYMQRRVAAGYAV